MVVKKHPSKVKQTFDLLKNYLNFLFANPPLSPHHVYTLHRVERKQPD